MYTSPTKQPADCQINRTVVLCSLSPPGGMPCRSLSDLLRASSFLLQMVSFRASRHTALKICDILFPCAAYLIRADQVENAHLRPLGIQTLFCKPVIFFIKLESYKLMLCPVASYQTACAAYMGIKYRIAFFGILA